MRYTPKARAMHEHRPMNTVRMVFSVDGVRCISLLFLYRLNVSFMGWYFFFWVGQGMGGMDLDCKWFTISCIVEAMQGDGERG